MASIVVVGGGVAGLAAAYELKGSSHELMLVEKDRRLGGKIRSVHAGGFLLEDGPESILTRKPAAVELAGELGIAESLVGRTPRRRTSFIYHGGRLHPLPEGFTGLVPSDPDALEATSLLSPDAKQRILREPEIPPGREGDESVASFMTRRFGREAFEVMIEPLVTGIFGGDARHLSIHAAFPQLVSLERRAGFVTGRSAPRPRSGSNAAPFVTFAQGMETLVSALSVAVGRDRVSLAVGARRIERRGERLAVSLEDGQTREADGLILATQPGVTAELLSSVSPTLSEAHASIPTSPAVVVNVGFRREDVPDELDGYGYLSPSVDGRRFHGCTWSSSKWPGRAPKGFVLFRLYGGKFGQDELIAMSDEEITREARAELSETLGVSAEPAVLRTVRWPQAIPQYNIGHGELMRTIEETLLQVPGLFLAGAAYEGVGIPDCIRSGQKAGRAALEYLERR